MVTLDNRGLTPPDPMVRTLEAAEQLEADQVLVVLNDRRPMFLYPLLAERGYECETLEQADGSVRLHIRRRPGQRQ